MAEVTHEVDDLRVDLFMNWLGWLEAYYLS